MGDLQFENTRDFSEGLAAVQKDGKWGFIDTAGRLVIPYTYGSAGDSSDGLAQVAEGGLWEHKKWGYIDRTGKLVIPYQFERAENFSDGLAPVAKNSYAERDKERYFYIGENGKQAFPGIFLVASPFFKGLGHVKLADKTADDDLYLRGKFAYIDKKGHTVFSYKRKSG